jgi:RNA polymerase sigma-70 factor (ECF subfamily)
MALRTYGKPDQAQDLVQETFKEAWRSFDGFQPGTDCKAWLFRIYYRVLSRRRKLDRSDSHVALEALPESRLAVAPQVGGGEEGGAVIRILQAMPEHYRSILVLADVEGLTYREIARLLDLPLGTVMSRLNRARALFREKFQHAQHAHESA